jgi:hypothetical protein
LIDFLGVLLLLEKYLVYTNMSSLLTTISQVDSSVKYLKATSATTVYTPNAGASISSNMSAALFTSSTTAMTYPSGTTFRDMGKKAMTYNTRNDSEALYILVQPQQGPETEGVPFNYEQQKFYVRVWASSQAPTLVTVARLG